MGGLGKKMKTTAWTFAIGALALSGIPPFSGFWSKDAILTTALDENPVLFVVGLAAAFCTALYMSRLFFLVFAGKPRSGHAAVKESAAVMTIPMIILAALSVVAGFIETPWNGWLSGWLSGSEAVETVHGGSSIAAMVASIGVGALGIYLGWLFFVKKSIGSGVMAAKLPGLLRTVERGYYIDEWYRVIIVKPLRGLGTTLAVFDEYVIGGTVRMTGALTTAAGRFAARLSNGKVQTYGLAALIGCIILITVIVGRRFWS